MSREITTRYARIAIHYKSTDKLLIDFYSRAAYQGHIFVGEITNVPTSQYAIVFGLRGRNIAVYQVQLVYLMGEAEQVFRATTINQKCQ